jgi:hypothetical protein
MIFLIWKVFDKLFAHRFYFYFLDEHKEKSKSRLTVNGVNSFEFVIDHIMR